MIIKHFIQSRVTIKQALPDSGCCFMLSEFNDPAAKESKYDWSESICASFDDMDID